MKILITGAFGFVGTNLSSHLAKRGFELWALDVGNAFTEKQRARNVYKKFFDWKELEQIPWVDVDAVIHLAGKAHDTRNASNPQSYYDVNVGLTRKVLDAAVGRWRSVVGNGQSSVLDGSDSRQGSKVPRRFVMFSSVKAVADRVDGVLTEDVAPAPKTPYGRSKLAAEREVLKLGASDIRDAAPVTSEVRPNENDFLAYILRPCMIHGPGNKGNLNLLYGVVRRSIPWPLGAYNNRRSFASIGNVCAVVEGLLVGRVPSGAYQVADDEALSTNELIRVMAAAMGRRPWIVPVPRAVVGALAWLGDVARLPLNSERLKKLTESYIVSNVKIKSALGWDRMPVRAVDGLRVTVESFCQDAQELEGGES